MCPDKKNHGYVIKEEGENGGWGSQLEILTVTV